MFCNIFSKVGTQTEDVTTMRPLSVMSGGEQSTPHKTSGTTRLGGPTLQHCVSEIRKLTTTHSWNFCPGEKNPADLPSHGICGPDLAENEIWWNGAEFLQFPKEMWPSEPGTTEFDENEANTEIMKHKTPPSITKSLNSVSETVSSPNIGAVIDCKCYSSQTKLL